MSDAASEAGLSLETAVEVEEGLRRQVLAEAGLIESLDDEEGLVFPLPRAAKIIHRGVLSNLTPGWLPALCEWANQDDELEESYAVQGMTIECDGEPFPLLGPEAIGTPAIDQINELWP